MRAPTPITLLLLLSCVAAHAANPHFQTIAFVDNGLTLTMVGTVIGMGGENTQVDLSATANANATCTDQNGVVTQARTPPPVAVSANPSTSIRRNKSMETFSPTTNPPTSPVPGAPDCPSNTYTENYTDLSFTSAVITIEEPIGNVANVTSCSFAPPTINGAVAKGTVTCK